LRRRFTCFGSISNLRGALGTQIYICEMSMDLLGRLTSPPIEGALEADIRRIVAIWNDTRARFGTGGPFLFGAFSNADAMYAPVATRFRTYGVDLARFGDDGTAAS
jgi:glutathione S-transferase